MRERKTGTIVATARELFLTRGYEGTSLDDVAAVSGVSKTTVYNNFADKDALFIAVVTEVIDRAQTVATALTDDLSGAEPVETRLRAAARRLVIRILDPTVIQLRRLAISEAPRFPDLAELYWSHAPASSLAIIASAFADMHEQGLLLCPDSTSAAHQFAYSVIGPAQDLALLNPRSQPTQHALVAQADLAVDAFMRAYRPMP